MPISRLFAFLLLWVAGFSLSGCQSIRARRLVADGYVSATDYVRTVPLERYGAWRIVEVQLAGGKRPYRLLFDTGAVTVLKPSVAEALGLPIVTQRRIGSANGQTRTLPFVVMPRCTVGGIAFEEVGAVLVELDSSPELACLNAQIDGIMGANMMRLAAAWEIDYEAETLTFSDQLDALPGGRTGYAIPFKASPQGSPRVRLSLWGETVEATLDTGKGGGLGLSANAAMPPTSVPQVRGFGQVSVGAFGAQEDTLRLVQAHGVALGGLVLDTVLVTLAPARKNLIGNGWLQHFRVTLDWAGGRVYLLPKSDVPSSMAVVGLGHTLRDSALVVSFLYEGSPAERSGLALGDTLLRIGGQSVERLSPNAFCRIREEGLLPAAQDSIEVRYRGGDGAEREAVLYRARLW